MKPILSLFFFLLINLSVYSQVNISIVDKSTNENIPFVTIAFGNDDGVYTNENGQFNLELIKTNSIIVSALGYKTRTIIINTIKNNTIFLEPDNVLLEEVLISNKKKKFKIKKAKSINDKNFLNSYRNSIGNEIACFIENNHG
jgi:hypothetical protein